MNQPMTQTCDLITRFLNVFHAEANRSLDGMNLNVLLLEVAVGVRSQLLEHFRKWQVSEVGGVVLARDMARYVDVLRNWKIKDPSSSGGAGAGTGGNAFEQSLEMLTELASLFVLKPEALRERIRGGSAASGSLGGVSKEVLRGYLVKRDDYDGVAMGSLLRGL